MSQSLVEAADAAILRGESPSAAAYPDTPGKLLDGLGYLARYQRTGQRSDIERASFLFNQQSAAGRSAWPHYLSARAFELLDRLEAPQLNSDGKLDGERNVDAMWRQLAEAIRHDPELPAARRLAMHHLVRSGDRELREDHLKILASELARPDVIAEAFLVQGRHERTARRYAEAIAAFEEAARRGADQSVVALESARTARALDDTVAASAHYWRGIDHLTEPGRELYRLDLAWIVSDDSVAGFDRAAARGEQQVWLERFWGQRDAASGRQPGGRLLEHLRRWNTAHERYRIPAPWTRDIFTRFWHVHGGADCVASATTLVDSLPLHPPHLPDDLRRREPLLDHRGFVYLRHGEPAARATPPIRNSGVETPVVRESWVYWIEGRWRSFHFDGSSTFGVHAPTTMMTYLPLDEVAWFSLARMLPEYHKAAIQMVNNPGTQPNSCLPSVQEAIARQHEDVRVQWRTDSDSPRITAPWNAAIRTFALGTGARGDGRAVVSFALPFDQLAADTLLDDRIVWRARFAFKAFRPSDGRTITVDSLRQFIGETPPPDANLTMLFELPLDPGHWELSMTVDQGSRGTGAFGLSRNLVIGPGTGLALSDIVPGREGSPVWNTITGPFPLNAVGTWKTREMVELYYEVYGLEEGDDYQTSIEVVPLNPRSRNRVAISATERATGPLTVVHKSLGLNRLTDGVYRIIVTIERGGVRVVREQEILIVKAP